MRRRKLKASDSGRERRMELQQKVEGRDARVRWWWRTASARSEGREAAARERKEEAAVGSRRRTPVRSRCAWSWRKWRTGRGDAEVRMAVAAAEGEGAERGRRARERRGASAMARREGVSDGVLEWIELEVFRDVDARISFSLLVKAVEGPVSFR
jgi:hypothetical protein